MSKEKNIYRVFDSENQRMNTRTNIETGETSATIYYKNISMLKTVKYTAYFPDLQALDIYVNHNNLKNIKTT